MMPRGVFKTINIPKSQVKKVVNRYKVDNPKKIEEIEQSDGRWTVKAIFEGSGEQTKEFSE